VIWFTGSLVHWFIGCTRLVPGNTFPFYNPHPFADEAMQIGNAYAALLPSAFRFLLKQEK